MGPLGRFSSAKTSLCTQVGQLCHECSVEVISNVNKNGHFSIQITQAFGNCPKYITRRRVQRMGSNLEFAAAAEPVTEASKVGALEASIISNADNMYFGTGTPEHGADMNIRGGSPGFVRILHDGSTICWPDYTGNGFYMSLGNVQLQNSASLVFVDWDDTGRGVQIAGAVRTLERPEVVDTEMLKVLSEEPQALRLVTMSVQKLHSIPRYSPHIYEKVELSPYNPRPTALGPDFLAVLQWARRESKDRRGAGTPDMSLYGRACVRGGVAVWLCGCVGVFQGERENTVRKPCLACSRVSKNEGYNQKTLHCSTSCWLHLGCMWLSSLRLGCVGCFGW